MALWHTRIASALEDSGHNWSKLAQKMRRKYGGGRWVVHRKTKEISGEPLVKAAIFLNVSEAWILGISPVKHRIGNLALVTDSPQDGDVLVPQYQTVSAAAGGGCDNSESEPTDYVTFKQSWLKRKGLNASSVVVIYAKGDSMAPRVRCGDVVLIDTEQTVVSDGGVFAFVYDDMARLKRLVFRVSGSIGLVSDNDPDGSLREDLSRETLDQLHIIGRAVWVGGDLR